MVGETPKRRGRPPSKPKENDDQEKTTVQPAKRRGRPPKPKQQADDDAQQGSATPKRGRGRPPKTKNEAVAASTVKAKSTKVASEAPAIAAKTAPRPRGRPRKSETGTASAKAKKETAKAPTKAYSTIVGGYAVACEAISGEWPDKGEDFDLDIFESSTPGVYEGSFDFGILEGAMVLSSDETLLDKYVEKLDTNEDDGYSDEDEDGDDEDDDDEDEPTVTGKKRKVTKTPARGRTAKKVKKAPSPGLGFHILWRGRDTSEGEVHFKPGQGMIKFTNKHYTKFAGKVDLPSVGKDVEFTGEKVTDRPNARGSSWNKYSEAEYERANTSRWH